MKRYLFIGASALVLSFAIYNVNLNKQSVDAIRNQEKAREALTFSQSTAADTQTIHPWTVGLPEPIVPALDTNPQPTIAPTPKTTPAPTPKATPKAAPKATPKPTTQTSPAPATTAPSGKASAIITTAKSYMGVPYVWGGTSPSGFDCSGFIQYVYNKNGISLPRVTSEQYKAGTSISKSNLQPGDLVFFETYQPGASHVGIYLGSNQFIHASSGKGEVMISSLTSTYYTQHYYGARRVIK